METKEEKRFSIRKRLSSANHALRGIGILFKTTHNAQAYPAFILILGYLGYMLHISALEWVVLIVTVMVVFAIEALNTALEIYADYAHPERHPSIRDAKDIAAGAVMMSVILGGIIGMIIFIPKVIALYR